MKALFVLLISTMAINSCAQEEVKAIEYTSVTRGSYERTVVSSSVIEIWGNRNEADKRSMKITKEEWNELIATLKAVDFEEINELEAPTNDRLFDGAAIGTIMLTTERKQFQSAPFDSGVPPKELALLYTKLQVLKEQYSE